MIQTIERYGCECLKTMRVIASREDLGPSARKREGQRSQVSGSAVRYRQGAYQSVDAGAPSALRNTLRIGTALRRDGEDEKSNGR